jgi:hypothetical protein
MLTGAVSALLYVQVPWRTQLWAGAVEVVLLTTASVMEAGRWPTPQESLKLLGYSLVMYFVPHWQCSGGSITRRMCRRRTPEVRAGPMLFPSLLGQSHLPCQGSRRVPARVRAVQMVLAGEVLKQGWDPVTVVALVLIQQSSSLFPSPRTCRSGRGQQRATSNSLGSQQRTLSHPLWHLRGVVPPCTPLP